MTGFGAAEGGVGGGRLRIELRSVNHRYLSVSLKAPNELAGFELEIRERLRRDLERGHLTVSVRWLELPSDAAGAIRVDPEAARAAVARLRELQAIVGGLESTITVDLVSRQPNVFVAADGAGTPIEWSAIEPVLGAAIAELLASRRREGAALAEELGRLVALLRSAAATLAGRAPERLLKERDRLRAAVGQLLDGRPVEEQRLAQELAFLAERLDVTEELVRLEAHLAACDGALAGSQPVGKRLGFLAQEIGREINTIGSKANDAAMQHLVVEMKGELERFREQLENLE